MNPTIVFALCMGVLFCVGRTCPLPDESEKTPQDLKSCSLSVVDGANNGARKMLQSTNVNVTLLIAVDDGDAAAVKSALERGADPSFPAPDGKHTPLIIAGARNEVEILKILLKAGAKVGFRTRKDGTALEFAAVAGSTEAVKVLLEAGADPNEQDSIGLNPVHRASIEGHVETVKALIEAGGELEGTSGVDSDGHTPLHIAAAHDRAALVEYLLELGAKVDAENVKRKRTPLQRAAAHNAVSVIKVLLKAGANVNHADANGVTPLMMAAFYGHQEVIEILLDAGANKEMKDRDGDTAKDGLCQCIFSFIPVDSCNKAACEKSEKMSELLKV